MVSQVEKNQTLVTVGDALIYTDESNSEKWTVTEVFEGGFQANDGFETKDFYFRYLQLGWTFSKTTMERHILYDRFKYAA